MRRVRRRCRPMTWAWPAKAAGAPLSGLSQGCERARTRLECGRNPWDRSLHCPRMTAALAYGLSVHHFISQVGDYVGFAAIVAVAIMVLLLFAHARETADLRRRAAEAEDELALLHEQVQWLRDAQQSGPPPAA